MLSEEQKQRIEAEEKYRQEYRQRLRSNGPPPPRGAERWPPDSDSHPLRWIGAIAVAAVIGAAFLVHYAAGPAGAQEQPGSRVPQFLQQWRPAHLNIASGVWEVKPSGYLTWNFEVPAGARNFRMTGHYSAAGGFGNDIAPIVASQDDFANWINGHPARAYFLPGKLTAGDIAVTLPPGRYTLGFSNTFSLLSAKNISVEAGADYEILQ